MRHPSAALSSPRADVTRPHAGKYVAVHLLTGQSLHFIVQVKCKLSELFAAVVDQMCHQGLHDPELFGLAVTLDGEYIFVDPDSKVGKYAPKAWKTSQTNGLDRSGRPLLRFNLRVKYYVECHRLLRDRVSRHHYYLQLRENVLVHQQRCQQQTLLLLAAWALQADLGDFSGATAGRVYFRPADYLPAQTISELGVDYIVTHLPALHADNSGMSRADAERAYIREASAVEAPHNLHVYRLKRRKTDAAAAVLLAICPNGIELYQEDRLNSRKLMASFVWTNISKLSFEKKKFEISALTQKFTFFTSNDEKSKHLFQLCKDIHLFTQSLKDRILELKQRTDHAERRGGGGGRGGSLRQLEAQCSGWEYLQQPNKAPSEQRVSVSSTTSSNTTSGVVSDRTVHSLDDSDDDLPMDGIATRVCIAESVESGVESLPRSHSRLDEGSPRAVQSEMAPDENISFCPGANFPVASSKTSVESTPAGEASLSGSGHSSSSQQSASTVRSLAKTPSKSTGQRSSTDISASSDAVFTAAPANCCSTCVDDDAVSVCSDPGGTRTQVRSGRQCACSMTGSDRASVTSGSTLYARQSGSPRSLHTATGSDNLSLQHLSQDSQASAASTADSTRAIDNDEAAAATNAEIDVEHLSDYDLTSGDDSGLGSRHYVDFYEPAIVEGVKRKRSRPPDSLSVKSAASATSNTSSLAMTLDYSVHSAHTSVGSVITTPGSFPRRTTVSDTFDTDSDYVQVPYDTYGEFKLSEPSAGVSMATVTTVTPVCLASSQQTNDVDDSAVKTHASSTEQADKSTGLHHTNNVVSVPAAPERQTSEAAARFITTRPLVTVFRALASVAVTQSASYSQQPQPVVQPPRVSLPRSLVASTVPSPIAGKPKSQQMPWAAGSDLLLRVPSQDTRVPGLPVIGRNNYLDVHASHPAMNPYSELKQSQLTVSSPSLSQSILNRRMTISQQVQKPEAKEGRTAGNLPENIPLPIPKSLVSRPGVATVYTNQVTRSQIEQFQKQLLSDTDYVIYPLKDPEISRQEYVEAKHCKLVAGSMLPPPPYRGPKMALQYQSTPNVAEDSGAASTHAVRTMTSYLSSPNVAAVGCDQISPSSVGNVLEFNQSRAMSTACPVLPVDSIASPCPTNESSVIYAGATSSSTSSGPTYSSGISLADRLDSLRRQQLHLSTHSLASSGTYAASSVSAEPALPAAPDVLATRSVESRLFHATLLAREHHNQTRRRVAGVVRAKSDDNLLSSSSSEMYAAVTASKMERAPPSYWQARSRLREATNAAPYQEHQQQARQYQQQQQQQQRRLAAEHEQTLLKHQQLIREHLQRIQQRTPVQQSAAAVVTPQQQQRPPPAAAALLSQQPRLAAGGEDAQPHHQAAGTEDGLDIYGLRLASRRLDLPLISALCNDRLLRRPARPKTWHEATSAVDAAGAQPGTAIDGVGVAKSTSSHPAAGQPILAKHKTLAIPSFYQTGSVQPVPSIQLQVRRTGALTTSHRHPTAPTASNGAPQTQATQVSSNPSTKKDVRPSPVGIR